MSDPRLALLVVPFDPDRPAEAVEWLHGISALTWLSGAERFVAATVKDDLPKGVRLLNLGANYPAEYARVISDANVVRGQAGGGQSSASQVDDGLMLYALYRLVAAHPEVDTAIVLRGPVAALGALPAAGPGDAGPAFELAADAVADSDGHGQAPLVFRRKALHADLCLTLAVELVLDGRIHAMPPGGLARLLDQVAAVAQALADARPSGATETC